MVTQGKIAAALLMLAWAVTAGAAASPIEGTWLVQDGEAHIRIERCGSEHCGAIVWLREPLDENGKTPTDTENPDPSLRSRTIMGLDILHFGVEPDEDGIWRSGRIYDPENGKTYRCTLALEGDDALRLRGYVGVPLFGRTTRWTRIAEKAAPR
jgi:uncharacterized protein (DUF2147 family)